jgi:multicomponent Na+:H+ antiporter subunit G
MDLAGSVLILLGTIFLLSSGLGLLRMPDVFTRLQAGTKAATLGNMLVLTGIAFLHPGWSLKLLMIVYFVLITNPISSHALARAAHTLRSPRPSATAVEQVDDIQQTDRSRA